MVTLDCKYLIVNNIRIWSIMFSAVENGCSAGRTWSLSGCSPGWLVCSLGYLVCLGISLLLQYPMKLIYKSEDTLFFLLSITFNLILFTRSLSLQIILLLTVPKFHSLPFSSLGRLDTYFISSMDQDDLHGLYDGQTSFVTSTRKTKWNVGFAWMNCLPCFERNVWK